MPYSRTSCTAASSCVIPSTIGAPFLSVKRSNSLPTVSYLPDSSHKLAGSATGNNTSCPSIASISSRMICSIFLQIRLSGIYCEKIPLATNFIYPPRIINEWLSITQSAGFSLKRSPTSLSNFINLRYSFFTMRFS